MLNTKNIMNVKKTITYSLICLFLSGLILSYLLYDWSFASNTITFEKIELFAFIAIKGL